MKHLSAGLLVFLVGLAAHAEDPEPMGNWTQDRWNYAAAGLTQENISIAPGRVDGDEAIRRDYERAGGFVEYNRLSEGSGSLGELKVRGVLRTGSQDIEMRGGLGGTMALADDVCKLYAMATQDANIAGGKNPEMIHGIRPRDAVIYRAGAEGGVLCGSDRFTMKIGLNPSVRIGNTGDGQKLGLENNLRIDAAVKNKFFVRALVNAGEYSNSKKLAFVIRPGVYSASDAKFYGGVELESAKITNKKQKELFDEHKTQVDPEIDDHRVTAFAGVSW